MPQLEHQRFAIPAENRIQGGARGSSPQAGSWGKEADGPAGQQENARSRRKPKVVPVSAAVAAVSAQARILVGG